MLTRFGRAYAEALSWVSGFALVNPGLSRVSEFVPAAPGLGFAVVAITGEGIVMDGANPASASVRKRRSVSPFTGGAAALADGPAAGVAAGIGGGDGMSSGVGARPGPVAAAVCSFDGGNSEARRSAAVSQS